MDGNSVLVSRGALLTNGHGCCNTSQICFLLPTSVQVGWSSLHLQGKRQTSWSESPSSCWKSFSFLPKEVMPLPMTPPGTAPCLFHQSQGASLPGSQWAHPEIPKSVAENSALIHEAESEEQGQVFGG